MRFKLPWIDRTKCDIREHCESCKAADHCINGAFYIMRGENGASCTTAVDLEQCKRCGECEHACERGAVKMI